PVCTAALDNGVTTSTLTLTNAMPNGAFVETTLQSVGTSATRNQDFQDLAGNTASAPQARQATATAPETTQPFIASVSGAVGSTTLKFTFSEPIMCNQAGATTAWTYDSNDITLSDGNTATVDPTVTGAGTDTCGATATTADT